MASASNLPQLPPPRESSYRSETEPLLGRLGDAVLSERTSLVRGLFSKTGILAEIGVLILCCDIWARIASTPVIFFSGHPIAMSTAIFILTQSILFQQPIAPEDLDRKRRGQYVHAALSFVAFMALVTGFTIVEITVARMKGAHFPSPHAICGLLTLLLIVAQYVVGFTMWMTPSLYGGEARAKSLYKYHRYSGYFILLMILATAVTATLTGYNRAVLGAESWVVSLGALLIAIGVFPRIQKQKLGFGVS
jgi:hypothetical protein